MRRYTWLSGAVILVIAAALGGWLRPWQLIRPSVGSSLTAQNVAIGSSSPAFTLPELSGGRAVSLGSLRGHPVLVNFWATWCRYCVHEMPLLERASRVHPGLVVLGVDNALTEPSTAKVSQFIKRVGVTYPILLDVSGAVVSQYQVRSYPTSFFVDSSGVIRGVVVGELMPGLLEAELSRILPRRSP